MQQNKRKLFTTERGVTVSVVPIPLFLDKIRKAHPDPPPPTYEVELAGGAVQRFPHDETTLKTDEDRAAFAAWKAAKEANDRLLNDLIQRAVFEKAIHFIMPEDDAWVRDQESYGIVVPTDAVQRRIHYLETEVIGGPLDIVKLTALANGVELGEEALRAAEDSFQRLLQRNTAQSLNAQAGALDSQ